jgi:hypothetical protein
MSRNLECRLIRKRRPRQPRHEVRKLLLFLSALGRTI